jgi:hypothetical protein
VTAPTRNRRGIADGAKGRDMLAANSAVDAAAFRDGDLHPDLQMGFDSPETREHA